METPARAVHVDTQVAARCLPWKYKLECYRCLGGQYSSYVMPSAISMHGQGAKPQASFFMDDSDLTQKESATSRVTGGP